MSRLHIDSITKSFNDQKILQDIYLECKVGNIAGILGRNGSGKSTLLKIISGVLGSDTQFIKWNDQVLRNISDRKNRIAYLPQHSFLPKSEKLTKLIHLFCNREYADQLLHSQLLSPFLNEKPRNLSSGELRMIEVMLLTYSQADFVLLDEPFNSLSPKIIDELKAIIRSQAKNKGFIISDHHYQDVVDIADKIYLLSSGYLKPIQNLQELRQYNYLPNSI
ncbi:ATP-binding cassette domain-containing protein [Chryseobacterium sp. Mn2064]|uniref:ATP-binding cassette domain-containing protein n=1 Tax=Chryseobacterium sp. Mn2064 TaxID=3395263 RepID=UPI003BBAD86B